jgi:hypothetical protein
MFELRRKKDLIIMHSTDLYTFARLHASLDDVCNLDDCSFWDESYPIIEKIMNRLGFTIKEHDKQGVCVSYSKGKINVRNFDLR